MEVDWGIVTLIKLKGEREAEGECEDVVRYKVERGAKMLSSLPTENAATRVG
jgi:hypothetical protein